MQERAFLGSQLVPAPIVHLADKQMGHDLLCRLWWLLLHSRKLMVKSFGQENQKMGKLLHYLRQRINFLQLQLSYLATLVF